MSEPNTPSLVIGVEDLKKLTGYKQKTAIAAWCRKNGIKFFRDARGWPVTTEGVLNATLWGHKTAEPDWSACDNRAARRQRRAPEVRQ